MRGDLGRWLKAKREAKGLSIRKASELLGYPTMGMLNSLEYSKGNLPVEKIHPIAEAYGIPIDEMLEKIREYEPDLFEKYMTLKKQFYSDFSRRVMGIRPGEIALHHQDFMSDKSTYGNYSAPGVRDKLYIMSTSEILTQEEKDFIFGLPLDDPNQLNLFEASA